ncbi:MAG: hypothetical protein RIM23_25620 [Coleofasciculus sp. G3-WIS-01]|uniref:hypothetical protein n=1 Tax=Coleofasciculus sp. G3-WIS-01 TaxID=3069528 RepID=UPI0032F791DC
MSIGSLVWQIREKYKHGLKTAYYRDYVRDQIFDSRPVTATNSHICELHVLTSATDWLNLIWVLKSFYYFSNRHYALCIHDDGTLTDQQCKVLQDHFPDARVIDRKVADDTMQVFLESYPRCLEFRQTNHLSPKVFDFIAYLESDRMLLLDSDVLFFQEPTELLRRIESPIYSYNSVNRDIASAYTVDSAVVRERMGFTIQPRFNSGLGLIHKKSMNLDWIEQFLSLPGIIGHFWRIEQTLFALCSSKFGVDLLPEEYDVHLGKGIKSSPCRHYVGAIRHLMYSEGIRNLVKTGFLKELSQ